MTQKIKMTTQPIVGPLRHQVVTIFWMEKHVPKLSWKVWRSTDFLFTSKKTCRKFWHEFGVPMKRPKKRVDFLILCQFPLDFNSTKYHQFHEIHHTWSHISASSFDQFLWSWIMAITKITAHETSKVFRKSTRGSELPKMRLAIHFSPQSCWKILQFLSGCHLPEMKIGQNPNKIKVSFMIIWCEMEDGRSCNQNSLGNLEAKFG